MRSDMTTAGGRATEAGMTFQAAVGAWLAAYLAADMPVGGRFGLNPDARVQRLECETGEALDDVVAVLDTGGRIYAQCKTNLALSKPTDVSAYGDLSPLGKTLHQLAELWLKHKDDALLDGRSVAVLAVREKVSGPLSNLEAGCRAFDGGGDWPTVSTRGAQDIRDALQIFAGHLRNAWKLMKAGAPSDDDFVQLARRFRIRAFSEDDQGADWREASQLLGRRLYKDEAAGAGPMGIILAQVRCLIRSGAPLERPGVIRALRHANFNDVAAPSFNDDIDKLRNTSLEERRHLAAHRRLPIAGAHPIPRDVLGPLVQAVREDSLLLTGEPGAGKTGVMLALAEQLETDGDQVIFLSVERFAGIHDPSGLQNELKLKHDLTQVLTQWPGTSRLYLLIDALDASRGGPAEAILSRFITEAVPKLRDRWSIVASIRSFDLRNGQRFRALMPGAPPLADFREAGLDRVRHVEVKRLSSAELVAVAADTPKVGVILYGATDPVQGLLRNIFNLSLAAELLEQGMAPEAIQTVTSQSELIRSYEDIRLSPHALVIAAADAVTAMVQERRLSIPRIRVRNASIADVEKNGVVVAAGDRIAFAHHVLFDHIAGRFFLRWDDLEALAKQVTDDPALGLLLGPAFCFALEMAWQDDQAGKPKVWAFLANITALAGVDPVVVSVALRTAADHVERPQDVAGLRVVGARQPAINRARLVGRLAGFVSLRKGRRPLSAEAATAWSEVAGDLAAGPDPIVMDAARILLYVVSEGDHDTNAGFQGAFGRAARRLLTAAWAATQAQPQLVTAAIRLVTRSFGSDPQASRALLAPILTPARLNEHAADEAPWLAEGVSDILRHDAAFVAEIYETLFTYEVTDETTSWIGGTASRILPLTSTRKQDYEMARWRLRQSLPAVLSACPDEGFKAVIGAVRGLAQESSWRRTTPVGVVEVDFGDRTICILNDYLSLEDWRNTSDRRDGKESVLAALYSFLEEADDAVLRSSIAHALDQITPASVWARLLGAAAERDVVADDLLWPLATAVDFNTLCSITRDAVIYLSTAYSRIDLARRQSFEEAMIVFGPEPLDDAPFNRERAVLRRLLSEIPAQDLATDDMRALQAAWASAGILIGNRPLVSIGVERGGPVTVDSLLRDEGIDLAQQPDQDIRDPARIVEELIDSAPNTDAPAKPQGEEATAAALAAYEAALVTAASVQADFITKLWTAAAALVAALEAPGAEEAQPRSLQSSWAIAAKAVAAIAQLDAYAPEREGHPPLDELVRFTRMAAKSPYPEVDETSDDMLHWSDWDIRIHAAQAVIALSARTVGTDLDLIATVEELLTDPVPTVRLQIATSLSTLWNVARPRMWALIEGFVARERHEGVLAFFMDTVLSMLSGAEPGRAADLLDILIAREWAELTEEERAGRDRDAEASARLAARLAVRYDEAKAWAWIERWSADLPRGERYLSSALHDLRAALFLNYKEAPTPVQIEVATRARCVMRLALQTVPALLAEARLHLVGNPSAAEIARWRPQYVAANQIVEQVCNELYFGTGAFHSGQHDEPPGLPTPEAKCQFLIDYDDVLNLLAQYAQARTIHNLVQLLGFLMEGDPRTVFDRLAGLILNRGAEEAYQFESLAAVELVSLVQRYLADHRDVFEDSPARRVELVNLLELFARAGWPDALRLLFELPDLMR